MDTRQEKTFVHKQIGEDLLEMLYDWDIVTELQKKKADGTYETISTEKTSEKDDVTEGSNTVKENGVYRIRKVVYAGVSGKRYRFTVYSNEVEVNDQKAQEPTTKPTEPATKSKAPSF